MGDSPHRSARAAFVRAALRRYLPLYVLPYPVLYLVLRPEPSAGATVAWFLARLAAATAATLPVAAWVYGRAWDRAHGPPPR